MDGGYTGYEGRFGLDGTVDKMVLVERMGQVFGHDRRLQELVLKQLSGVGSAADEQVLALEQWLCSLPYRREPGEVLRSPLETAKYGGDCDDFVVLTIAAATALGLPAKAEVIADAAGNGFHIRALVGLPPLSPSYWVIIDPVYRSEPQWAMANRSISQSSLKFRQTTPTPGPTLQGTFLEATPSTYGILAGAVVGFLTLMWWKRRSYR